MRKILIVLLVAVASLLFSVSNSYSTDNGNGVDVTEYNYNGIYKTHAEWFTAYDPDDSVNYIYNESDETGATSGSYNSEFVFDGGTILVSLPTYGGSAVTVRIEGKTKDAPVWGEIYSKVYSAATTIGEPFTISSYFSAIRVGVLVAGSAVDSLTIEADFVQFKRSGD